MCLQEQCSKNLFEKTNKLVLLFSYYILLSVGFLFMLTSI